MAFPLPGAGGPTTSLREMARRPTGQGPPSAPNMFRLNQCTRNFTFLARSSLLFTGIFCTVISTVTPFFISLHCSAALASGQTVYECATKGQTLQTGRSKHSWQKQSPRNGKKIPRGAGEAPGQQSVVGSLRHQQQSFPCTLLPRKAKCTAAALSCRPVQGHSTSTSSCACYGAARTAAAKVIGLQPLFSSNKPAG